MIQSKANIGWGDFNRAKQQHVYLKGLFQLFGATSNTKKSVATWLSNLRQNEKPIRKNLPHFIDQSSFNEECRYYEQIIADLNQVPSRESSWHDFFNGLIWMQFPQTKRVLNLLHVADIEKYGLHPRTLLRNQVTHFDECGLVLVGTAPEARNIVQLLQNHKWEQALFEQKDVWHTFLHPIIFGHANLEMLLNPFMGLTAKWVYVECFDMNLASREMPSMGCLTSIDLALAKHIQENQLFTRKGQLKPLPILGIPGWHEDQRIELYHQTDFFRPLRRRTI